MSRCAFCEDDQQVPERQCFFSTADVLRLTGLDEVTLGMAIRVGTMCTPDARTIHGQPLWSVDAVRAYMLRVAA